MKALPSLWFGSKVVERSHRVIAFAPTQDVVYDGKLTDTSPGSPEVITA